jgi:hypothetical protein
VQVVQVVVLEQLPVYLAHLAYPEQGLPCQEQAEEEPALLLPSLQAASVRLKDRMLPM